MNRDNIFLTENRRDVLAGESDFSKKSLTNEKSRVRTRARTAVDELIEVAQSTEVENRSVFDAEQIGTLLYWILNDPAMMGQPGGLIGTDDEPPEGVDADHYTKIPDGLQQYRHEVHSEAAQELLRIDRPGQGRK